MLSLSDQMIDSSLKCDNEDIRSNFMLLRQTIWHTFSLIQNLLQWAQTQTGRISFNPQPTNLNDTIKNNIELHRLKLNEKNLDFRINTDINVSVYVDPNMLNTIIRNLISNAIKFTPENGIVEVQYFDCDKISGIKACKENYVIVSIKDSGIGIEESIIDKLFMANSGYTSYGTNNEKGTGLGLALCKELIERNNVEIWV